MDPDTPVEIRHEDLDAYLNAVGEGTAIDTGPGRRDHGLLWSLPDQGRELDADLVHVPPRGAVELAADEDYDVLVLLLAGSGAVETTAGRAALGVNTLTWLPRKAPYSISAGPEGMTYLAVHRSVAGRD